MKLTINYRIDKQGQLFAAAHGLPAGEKQTITADITTPDDIEFFGNLPDAELSRDGTEIVIDMVDFIMKGFPLDRLADYRIEDDVIKGVGIRPDRFSFPLEFQEMVNWIEAREQRRVKLQADLPRIIAENRARAEAEKLEEQKRHAEWEAERAAEKIEEQKRQDERSRNLAEEKSEAAEWIRQHGSERLKLALDEGLLDAMKTPYIEERLAYEHPGWMFYDNLSGSTYKIINPSIETLQWFRANKIAGAALKYYKDAHEHGEDCQYDDCPENDLECPALEAEWRGKTIILLMNHAEPRQWQALAEQQQ